jgi:hypothetical protein
MSGFRREVDMNYVLPSNYAASIGNLLVTLREQPTGLIFKVQVGCPATSNRYYHTLLRNNPEKRSS